MEKINFQDNVTKANAETMNTFQNNIENAINGILESGSNENGYYIKFSDGTQICFGDGRGENDGFDLKTFAQPFIQKPKVIATADGSINYLNTVQINDITNNNAKFYVTWFDFNQQIGGYGMNKFNYIAIGKWK